MRELYCGDVKMEQNMYSEKQDLARYFTYLFLTKKMCYSGDILRTARKVTHLDNDTSCLPIYKKMIIMGMCDTPRQTQCARNYIFPHFVRVMVITVLWAELWFLVGVELCFFFKRVAWEE